MVDIPKGCPFHEDNRSIAEQSQNQLLGYGSLVTLLNALRIPLDTSIKSIPGAIVAFLVHHQFAFGVVGMGIEDIDTDKDNDLSNLLTKLSYGGQYKGVLHPVDDEVVLNYLDKWATEMIHSDFLFSLELLSSFRLITKDIGLVFVTRAKAYLSKRKSLSQNELTTGLAEIWHASCMEFLPQQTSDGRFVAEKLWGSIRELPLDYPMNNGLSSALSQSVHRRDFSELMAAGCELDAILSELIGEWEVLKEMLDQLLTSAKSSLSPHIREVDLRILATTLGEKVPKQGSSCTGIFAVKELLRALAADWDIQKYWFSKRAYWVKRKSSRRVTIGAVIES